MMKRKGLGKGLGMGYKNLMLFDDYVHSLSARGISTKNKENYFERFYQLRKVKKEEKLLVQLERGLGTPTFGGVTIRSVSGLLGFGTDAVGFVLPVIGIALGGIVGIIYIREKRKEMRIKSLKAKKIKLKHWGALS